MFDHLADRFLVEHAYRFKKSAKEDERSLKLHLRPKWARKRYAEIRRRDVVELIESIYASGRHALAVRLKATVSKIFAFAISKDLLDANPASGIGRIADLKPRERVLADDEIRMAWNLFMVPPASRVVGLTLRLVLATGQRPGEVAGMRVAELSDLADHQNAVWRLPAMRSKNGREHTIPLTSLSVSILQEALSTGSEAPNGKVAAREYVFPSPRTDKAITAHSLAVAMTRIAQQTVAAAANANLNGHQVCAETWLKIRPTPHDLRRTAATRMRALGFSSDDVKHILNHAPTSVLGRHYDRYDPLPEKRRALEAWAAYLERIVTD